MDEPDNLSPNSKHRKAAMESSFTPKVMRARSVSIKNRFKRKKSLDGNKFKEPSLIIHHPFDANALVKTPGLPDKPCISITTATPSKYIYLYLFNIFEKLIQHFWNVINFIKGNSFLIPFDCKCNVNLGLLNYNLILAILFIEITLFYGQLN